MKLAFLQNTLVLKYQTKLWHFYPISTLFVAELLSAWELHIITKYGTCTDSYPINLHLSHFSKIFCLSGGIGAENEANR